MTNNIVCIESISGNKPSEQFDFLSFRFDRDNINLVAHLNGKGYVKLFGFREFYEYFVLEQEDTVYLDIEQEVYDSDLLLGRIVKAHHFGKPLPQEELMFNFLGNGVSVCDCLRTEHGDYMTVAHIAENRKVTYYNPVSDEGRQKIEKFAREGNITIDSQGISALSPGSKEAMGNEENRKLLHVISSVLSRKRSYLDLNNEICLAFDGLCSTCRFEVEKLINLYYRCERDVFLWFKEMQPEEQKQLMQYYKNKKQNNGKD